MTKNQQVDYNELVKRGLKHELVTIDDGPYVYMPVSNEAYQYILNRMFEEGQSGIITRDNVLIFEIAL